MTMFKPQTEWYFVKLLQRVCTDIQKCTKCCHAPRCLIAYLLWPNITNSNQTFYEILINPNKAIST